MLTPNVMEYKRLVNSYLPSEGPTPDDTDQALRLLAASSASAIVMKGREDIIVTAGGSRYKCAVPGSTKRPGGLGDVLAGVLCVLVGWNCKRVVAAGLQGAGVRVAQPLPPGAQLGEVVQVVDGAGEGGFGLAEAVGVDGVGLGEDLADVVSVQFGPDAAATEEGMDHAMWTACWTACAITREASRRAQEKRKRAMTARDVLEEVPGVIEVRVGVRGERRGMGASEERKTRVGAREGCEERRGCCRLNRHFLLLAVAVAFSLQELAPCEK